MTIEELKENGYKEYNRKLGANKYYKKEVKDIAGRTEYFIKCTYHTRAKHFHFYLTTESRFDEYTISHHVYNAGNLSIKEVETVLRMHWLADGTLFDENAPTSDDLYIN